MAQANQNPGTTPQGSEPQNDGTSQGLPIGTPAQGDPAHSSYGGDNPPPTPPRKIAGKFDTLEEAVEKGYMGLEQGFHAMSEKVGYLTQLFEKAMTPQDQGGSGIPVGRGGPANYDDRGVDAYGRRLQPGEDEIDPKEFILNPGQVLKMRDEKLLNLVGRVVTDAISQSQVVNDFKSQNSDLAKHERLVKAFMDQQDQRLPLATRLANAAQSTRGYLAQMKAEFTGQPARVPAGSEYVEPARGQGQYSDPNAPNLGGNQNQPYSSNDEKELVDYINERQALYASHFGGPPK